MAYFVLMAICYCALCVLDLMAFFSLKCLWMQQVLSSNGSLESARSSIDSFEDAKENGYVEISKMSPRVKKAVGSSGNRSASLRGSDNHEENWECMSAMSVGMETWLVQEWCDMGSLDSLVERGLFMIDSKHLDMVRTFHICSCLDYSGGDWATAFRLYPCNDWPH